MGKVLVIGYGSIGKRHTGNLLKLGYQPVVLTQYPDDNPEIQFISDFSALNEFKDIKSCILCTPTSSHLEDFRSLISNSGCKNVLLEKPVEANFNKAEEIDSIAANSGINAYVGYVMRFYEVFDQVRDFIKNNLYLVRLVKITAGSYLPNWRPYKDYSLSYSAHKSQGGGVDLDTSHEIDYMLWLFGEPPETLFKMNGRISSLNIDSTDYFKALYKYEGFLVDLELDYFRKPERSLRLIGENSELLFADFVNKKLFIESREIADAGLFNLEEIYINELKEFLGLKPIQKLATMSEATKIYKYIKR